MARAGVPPWRIQLFGGWESSVVQRYIRDAGEELSEDLAALVCSSPVVKLMDEAADLPGAHVQCRSMDEVKELVKDALDEFVGDRSDRMELASKQDLEAALGRVEDRVRSMIVSPNSALGAPPSVRNALSEAGILHAPKSLRVTRCGWEYWCAPAAVAERSLDAEGPRCAKCFKGGGGG
eukprot:506506-Amphidinium_carterae.1